MTNEAQAKVDIGIVPQAKEVFGRQYKKFIGLVEELTAANNVKKQAEEESKRLNKELQSLWADCEAKTVLNDNTKITLVMSHHSTISKEELLKAGVLASVIQGATKMTPFSFVKVTESKA